MNDEAGQKQRCRRRGRPRNRLQTEPELIGRCYKPCTTFSGNNGAVILGIEELEILRLVDLNDLTQEEAAIIMGISRRSLWRDLHHARKKVADALVNGKIIEFEDCDLRNSKNCSFLDCSEDNPEQ